jgi:hypothetical protein
MTVAPLLETLELPVPDPRVQINRVSTVADHSPVSSFDPRARFLGACSVLAVLAAFVVSLKVLA